MRLTKVFLPVLGVAVAVALLAGPATADPPSGVPGGPCIEGEQEVQLSSLPSYEQMVQQLNSIASSSQGEVEIASAGLSGEGRELLYATVGDGPDVFWLQARIHGLDRREGQSRAGSLLERLGLAEHADRLVKTWSGGMRRRLDIGLALVNSPQVLFLDEPTTGLDPEARADLWDEIRRLRDEDGVTVLLTTHYLDEADRPASSRTA
jgi:ABC-type Na+ transport system ATPase subunit NatA